MKNRRFARHRTGTAAIEASLITPLLVLILLGAIDLGQYINVAQSVSNASREGARLACRNSTTSVTEVREAIIDYFSDAFPNVCRDELYQSVVVQIRDESTSTVVTGDLTSVASGAPLSVLVDMDFTAVRWLKGVDYWSGQFKQTTTVARRE